MEELHLQADIPQKAFLLNEGKILFALDRKGLWEPPGGRLHVDEEPAVGLQREMREELSLDVEVGQVLHTFVFTSANGVAHFAVVYLCRPVNGIEGMRMDEVELHGLKWIGPDDFEDLPMRDGYKDALRKYFAQ